jgi:hypothetical protein
VGVRQDRAVDAAQLDGWLARPEVSWSMGVLGAVAEFRRDADESARRAPGEVSTARGAIRLAARTGLRAVEHEATADPDRHGPATSLCLPLDDARQAGRTVLTVLGADTEAVRAEDRYAVLVDLGLGIPTLDVCVRVDDPGLLDVLASGDGQPFLADAAVAIAVVAASPPRVFRTALGRIEVYTPIPTPDGRSSDGPHTHLLPHLLQTGRTHADGAPIPAGWAPVVSWYFGQPG